MSADHLRADLAAGTPSARYRVLHETDYVYQSMVTLSQQYLHMSPRSFAFQRTDAHSIVCDPVVDDIAEGTDYFGNSTRHLTLTVPHKALKVRAESDVTLLARPGLAQIAATAPWEQLRDTMRRPAGDAALAASQYLYSSPQVRCSAELADYARASYTPGRPQLDAALALTERIFSEFEFDEQATDISTPLDAVLRGRRGVCQDFAQLMIGCLRSIGLPARYTSGYILTHPPAGQPRMIGADASHAWVSVFCPTLGWVDFDPSNRCLVQSEHITLGWGRDFSDVTPMRGIVLGGGNHQLDVRVTVTPLVSCAPPGTA
jgi:transglutaminase-like putative cysteine protease